MMAPLGLGLGMIYAANQREAFMHIWHTLGAQKKPARWQSIVLRVGAMTA